MMEDGKDIKELDDGENRKISGSNGVVSLPGAPADYKTWPEQGYVSEFLSMKCAGDVLNVVSPLGNKAEKEITEAMSVVRRLRSITLKAPMKYWLADFGAGNALASVISCHLLPIRGAIAIDRRARKRQWGMVRRFHYVTMDVEEWTYDPDLVTRRPLIIVSIHPCRGFALTVARKFVECKSAKHLVMMPCCVGGTGNYYFTTLTREKLDKYERWCVYLAQWIQDHAECKRVNVQRDSKCLSPCNIVVTAEKAR